MSAPAPEQPERLPAPACLAMPLERARLVYDLLLLTAKQTSGTESRECRAAADDLWAAVTGRTPPGVIIAETDFQIESVSNFAGAAVRAELNEIERVSRELVTERGGPTMIRQGGDVFARGLVGINDCARRALGLPL